jgi:hypothetical protein
MIIDGTNGLTFNNGTTQNSGGQVLQVVTSNFNSTFSQASSGSTLYATGHSVTITPKFSTSKIFIIATGALGTNSGNSWGAFATIYRGATNLAPLSGTTGSPSAFAPIYGPSGGLTVTTTLQYLDSPATTSATTYQVYIGGGGATVSWASNGWYGSNPATVLTVMEIAA